MDDIRAVSGSNAYLGQVTLFPPRPCPGNSSVGVINSASFGIVAVKQRSHNWMYLLSGGYFLLGVGLPVGCGTSCWVGLPFVLVELQWTALTNLNSLGPELI